MDISVIVVFRNEARFLNHCLQALLNQTYPHDRYEIIMVDGDSVDGSAAIAASSPRVRLLRESRKGAYVARNRGVAAATGDLIAFTDASCVVPADWLQTIADTMRSGNHAVIQGHRDFANDNLALSVLVAYEVEKRRYVFSHGDPRIYFGCMANIATRREVLEQIGPFAEIPRGADVVFMQRVIRTLGCGAVRYSPEIGVRDIEIRDSWVWLRKLFVYGRNRAAYRRLVPSAPLGVADRMRVMRRVLGQRGFSLPWIATALPLLVGGAICFDLGRCFPVGEIRR